MLADTKSKKSLYLYYKTAKNIIYIYFIKGLCCRFVFARYTSFFSSEGADCAICTIAVEKNYFMQNHNSRQFTTQLCRNVT